MHRRRPLHELESVAALLEHGASLGHCALQGLDLREANIDWAAAEVAGATFLGCRFASDEQEALLRRRGAVVFPPLAGLPYDPYRSRLYTWRELLDGWSPEADRSLDRKIYEHFVAHGRHAPDILEALAQRIHDHAVDDALRDVVEPGADVPRPRCVGFMGGHGTDRDHVSYLHAARTARLLARAGYRVVTGGGPGIMEAANLGAALADAAESELAAAVGILARAPGYRHPDYWAAAREVADGRRGGRDSLAIPTWFYGHEPTNLFATGVAKYFSNSLREDALLSVCLHGIVFAPGGAGTAQEIFADAAQNHYATLGVVSPMVFLGRRHYVDETGLYTVLERLARGHAYARSLHCCDDPEDVLAFLDTHPPVQAVAS